MLFVLRCRRSHMVCMVLGRGCALCGGNFVSTHLLKTYEGQIDPLGTNFVVVVFVQCLFKGTVLLCGCASWRNAVIVFCIERVRLTADLYLSKKILEGSI